MTVDANLMGLTSVENAASNAAVVVSNVTAGATLAASGSSAATTLTVKGAGLTGTEDTATIALTGNTGAVTYQSDSAQDIEKAAITVTGANTSALTIQDSGTNAGVTSVTVSGSGSYDMETGGNIADLLTTLDASANTGGVTFTSTVTTATALTGGAGNDVLTGAAGNDVIKGGAGDDTLAMGSAGLDHIDGGAGNDAVTVTGLTEDDSIVGGDGVDTLVISAAIAYDDEATPTPIDDAANISGFEVLRGTAALSQDMAALSGIVALQSTGGVLTATEASDIADFFAFGLTDVAGAGLDLTLATDGAADSLNIHVGLDAAQTNATGVTVDAIEIETALINSVGKDGNTITDFEADALTSLSVIGSKTLSVTLNDSAAVATIPLTKVDASAFTGDSLTITAVEADSGVTVTTGSEALSVTVGDGANNITGTAGDDEITTGDGADTIVSYAGDDEIVAGDGANTITVTDGENDIDGGEGVDTITAGDGNNTIDGGDGADVIVAGKGNNTITNSAGNATITAGNGNNNVTNTAGNSTITLGNGTNVVNLTAGNSTVITGSGADDINITAGNNDITAGAGNDSISLGSGNDTVDAGAGTDTVDFSVSSGTWTGAVSNAETVAATFTGSAKIDFEGITGYTALSVAASDDTGTVTLKNLASSALTISDDNALAGGAGDLEAVIVDTVDDATMTLTIGANKNAATATSADFTSLTITDADSITLKTSGGGFGNLLDHDIESLVLDDDETTSLTIDTAAYTSLETGAITGSEGLASLSVSSTGAESDVTVDGLATADGLTSLSIDASGLNAAIDVGQIGDVDDAEVAILDSISVTASNGGDANIQGNADGEEGDINTAEDLTSITISATGAGSTVTAGQIWADGLDAGAVSISASAGGVVDMETDTEADDIINYGFSSLSLSATGTDSAINASDLAQDAGSLAAATEADITIEADNGASITLGTAAFGAVDIGTLHIGVGEDAVLNDTETTVTASGDITNLDIDIDADGDNGLLTHINTGKILGTLSLNLGDEGAFDTNAFLIELTDDVDAEVGIKTLNLDIADQDGNATTVDLEAANAVTVNDGETEVLLSVLDVGESSGTYYQGSIILAGDDDDVVTLGSTVTLDAADLPTAGTEGVFGAWTITTGDGANTIIGSNGADTITSNGGADSVLGGAGNDSIAVGSGADTVGGGAGNDSIDLTESVSAADVVEFSSDSEVAAEANTSDSGFDEAESGVIDRGQDTITAFTAGTDTIKVTAVGLVEFVHGTDTDLGLGTATTAGSGAANFGTNVGLINLDNAETGDDTWTAGGDIVINFSSPTTTMTEALFEAALQYDVTGTSAADTITTGGLADTYTVTAGNDVVDLGAGDDTIAITATLLAANSGTTATIDGGTGTNNMSVTGAATLVDADFRGLSNINTLTFNTGDNTLTAGNAFEALIQKIDVTGTIDLALTQDTGDSLGTASAPLEIVALTLNSEATVFDFLGTDAQTDADLTGSGFSAVSNGAYTDADGTAASFFTAAAAAFAAGDVGVYVIGTDTYVFAEGASTGAADDVHLVLTGVQLTSVSATHGAAVLHIAG